MKKNIKKLFTVMVWISMILVLALIAMFIGRTTIYFDPFSIQMDNPAMALGYVAAIPFFWIGLDWIYKCGVSDGFNKAQKLISDKEE